MTTFTNQNILFHHVVQHSAGFHVDYFRIKMVFKSAYQRSFRGPKWDNFTVDEFQKKLQYRADRRSIEHQHQAWIWDSDSEEDVEEIPMPENKQDDKPVANLPSEPNDNERKRSVKAWVEEQRDIDEEKEKAPNEEEKKADQKVEHRKRNNVDEAEHRRRHHYHKHRSPRGKTYAVERHRELESPILDDLEEKKKHPPFLPYGWANDGPTDLRKTHNILASDREVCLLSIVYYLCCYCQSI